MNKSIAASLILTIATTTGCATAFAEHYSRNQHSEYFTDTARVTHVVPIYRTVRTAQPREECYEESINGYRDSYESATPTIAGGVVGGIIGNQFGKGNGKTFMTIAGTLLGGSIGRDYGHNNSRHNSYQAATQTRCEVINDYQEEEQLDGYRVSYRYQGKHFNTTLPYHPGKHLKVNVSVQPYE